MRYTNQKVIRRGIMVGELVAMLTAQTEVTIKDFKTGKTLFRGYASAANFNDRVVDWDFSREHIIFI